MSRVVELAYEAILVAAGAGALKCIEGRGEVVDTRGHRVGIPGQIEVSIGVQRHDFANIVAVTAEETRVIQVGTRDIQPEEEDVPASAEARLVRVASRKIGGVGCAAHIGVASAIHRNPPAIGIARAADIGGIHQGAAAGVDLRDERLSSEVQACIDEPCGGVHRYRIGVQVRRSG